MAPTRSRGGRSTARTIRPAGLLHGKVLRSPHAHGRIRSIDTSSEQHPFGVWGVGEANIIPPIPAIANAIYHATGVRMNSLPMNPGAIMERTWEMSGHGG